MTLHVTLSLVLKAGGVPLPDSSFDLLQLSGYLHHATHQLFGPSLPARYRPTVVQLYADAYTSLHAIMQCSCSRTRQMIKRCFLRVPTPLSETCFRNGFSQSLSVYIAVLSGHQHRCDLQIREQQPAQQPAPPAHTFRCFLRPLTTEMEVEMAQPQQLLLCQQAKHAS
jgi:hypothetical protein